MRCSETHMHWFGVVITKDILFFSLFVNIPGFLDIPGGGNTDNHLTEFTDEDLGLVKPRFTY